MPNRGVHHNLRQVTGKIPRELNDILRKVQDAIRGLRGFDGEIDLSNSISLTKVDLGSALKIFGANGYGGAVTLSRDDRAVFISGGSYRNDSGGWTATDQFSSIMELTTEGLNFYRDTNLEIGGTFIPTLIGPINSPGLGSVSTTVTTNYVIQQGDLLILVDASAGPILITLPPIASSEGRGLYVKKIDTSLNVVTVQGNANIDGDSSFDLLVEDEVIKVIADSSEWWIV